MKIAMLGGTFDPPHLGHLILADTVMTNCNYDKVLFIPAKTPPHKNISGKVSDTDRLNMLKLSVEDDERLFDITDQLDEEILLKNIEEGFEPDNQDIVILVNDIKGQILRFGIQIFRIGNFDGNCLS